MFYFCDIHKDDSLSNIKRHEYACYMYIGTGFSRIQNAA